jgi:predicted permease
MAHVWGYAAQATVGSDIIVKVNPFAYAGAGFAASFISIQIYAFILERSPQPFNKYIVQPAAASIHGNTNVMAQKHITESQAGKLAALVCIEYIGFAIFRQGFLRAETQKSVSMQSFQDKTLRLNQSITATKYKKPLGIWT